MCHLDSDSLHDALSMPGVGVGVGWSLCRGIPWPAFALCHNHRLARSILTELKVATVNQARILRFWRVKDAFDRTSRVTGGGSRLGTVTGTLRGQSERPRDGARQQRFEGW